VRVICPQVFIYHPEYLRHMSPDDPMAILARKIFEEYNTTGKISDYKWFVLQTPATSQWYIDDVIRYTNELVKISLCWVG
jgi:hypothetical protein